MEKKLARPIVLSAFGALCLFLGAFAFFFGNGALLLDAYKWQSAVYGYRALFLAFGSEAPYTASGFVTPKIAVILYLVAFVGYFLALSAAVDENAKKRYGLIMKVTAGLGILAALLFLFSHFEVPNSEGYYLIPGDGFIIPAATAFIPGAVYYLDLLANHLLALKKKEESDHGQIHV